MTSFVATRATVSSTRRMAGLAATMLRPSLLSVRSNAFCNRNERVSIARRTASTISSGSKGLGR